MFLISSSQLSPLLSDLPPMLFFLCGTCSPRNFKCCHFSAAGHTPQAFYFPSRNQSCFLTMSVQIKKNNAASQPVLLMTIRTAPAHYSDDNGSGLAPSGTPRSTILRQPPLLRPRWPVVFFPGIQPFSPLAGARTDQGGQRRAPKGYMDMCPDSPRRLLGPRVCGGLGGAQLARPWP